MPVFNFARLKKELSKNDFFFNPKTSSMRALLEAMTAKRSLTEAQQELDKIPHEKARKYFITGSYRVGNGNVVSGQRSVSRPRPSRARRFLQPPPRR